MIAVDVFCGVPVYIADGLCRRPVPKRELENRKWHVRRSYAARVNKKWLRRYGTKIVDSVFTTQYGMFVSTDTYRKLKQEAAKL